jgi:hypothetical protein
MNTGMTQFVVALLPFAALAVLWVFFIEHLQRRQTNDSRAEQGESLPVSPEPHDGWSPRGTIHTYRDSEAFREAPLLVSRFLAGSLLFVILSFDVVNHRLTWFSALVSAFCAAAVAGGYVFYRRERDGNCGEIRLSDDGTCELETKRRVTRLHVGEIRSVRYTRDSESEREHYTIYYRDGNAEVTQRMNGFLDFLTRLKTLNPAVDLSSFPAFLADTLPGGLGDPATGERANPANLFFRSALFPLLVVAALVWLAMQTLR